MKKPNLLFFDSNVYINLLRDPSYEKRLEPLLNGGFLYVVNKIVLMELWAGVKNRTEESILEQHQKSFPLIGIKDDQFVTAGRFISQMQKKHRMEPKLRRRITWDLLIALSTKENNAMLITENTSAFIHLRNWVDFEFMSVPEK